MAEGLLPVLSRDNAPVTVQGVVKKSRAAAVPETERGRHRSATPKGLHHMSIKIAALHQAQPLIREGNVLLTAAQAKQVLETHAYAQNRDWTRAQGHVDVLAENMRRGLWIPRDQIAFARMGDSLILINGHHRMAAQAQSGVAIEWSVVIYDCDTAADVASLYARYDTNTRVRSEENVLNALRVDEAIGVSKRDARAVWRAVPFLANGLATAKDRGDMFSRRIADDRFAVCQEYAVEARHWASIISRASGPMRRKLENMGSIVAVGIVTFRASPNIAATFWGGLADNDGLRKGDPRATLREYIIQGRRPDSGETIFACARAWNAHCEGKPLTVIKVFGAPIRIKGTNIEVAP